MIARQLQQTFEFALNAALERRHEYVTIEHLLFALLHDREVATVVRNCGGESVKKNGPTSLYIDIAKGVQHAER